MIEIKINFEIRLYKGFLWLQNKIVYLYLSKSDCKKSISSSSITSRVVLIDIRFSLSDFEKGNIFDL